MADEKDHDVPVKVVDRRRWREDGDSNPEAAPQTSRKPTYVEELEQKLAQREKEAEEYLTKYRQASREFDDARARMRKELAKDAERSRREVIISLLEVVDNLDRAIDAARSSERVGGTSGAKPLPRANTVSGPPERSERAQPRASDGVAGAGGAEPLPRANTVSEPPERSERAKPRASDGVGGSGGAEPLPRANTVSEPPERSERAQPRASDGVGGSGGAEPLPRANTVSEPPERSERAQPRASDGVGGSGGAKPPGNEDVLLQGVELVLNQFLAKLDGFGVKRISSEGAVFDPLLHEAVTAVPAADPAQDGVIVGVVRHGYLIGGEVLRPALVAVAKSAEPVR